MSDNLINIYPPKIIQFETVSGLYEAAYLSLEENILSTQGQEGLCRLLLSGGQSPLPLYAKIGQSPIIDWSRLELFQSDERFIESTSDHSNQFQIKKSLGDFATTELEAAGNLYLWPVDKVSPEESVQIYANGLESLDGVWFDEAILGIGPDGHVASLFPGADFKKHTGQLTVTTQTPDFVVTQRLSLTVESLLNCKKITILLVGKKMDTLQEMLEGKLSASDFPAKFLLAHPNLHILTCLE